ncbi:MAG: hypothetical protein ACRC4L_03815 [Mycoplasma sp.]
MEADIKKSNTILVLSIISIIAGIVGVCLFAFPLLTQILKISKDGADPSDEQIFAAMQTVLTFIVIGGLLSGLAGILCWVCAFMIFGTSWNSTKTSNEKTLWGILTIFLLGAIASTVFSIKAKNNAKEIVKEQEQKQL